MAEGVLLVLTGDECKKKEEYLGLDKEYEVEVLFGFSTDTYDILGKLQKIDANIQMHTDDKTLILNILKTFVGKFEQEYPPYSSKTVNGSSLHAIARSGESIEKMPTKEVEIFSIKYLGNRELFAKKLLSVIKERIVMVNGDFRQEETLNLWKNVLEKSHNNPPPYSRAGFQIVKIKVSCSSGTYMRSLAHNIGKKLSMPALAFSIVRTSVGVFKIDRNFES